jgi:hypothetical protein
VASFVSGPIEWPSFVSGSYEWPSFVSGPYEYGSNIGHLIQGTKRNLQSFLQVDV